MQQGSKIGVALIGFAVCILLVAEWEEMNYLVSSKLGLSSAFKPTRYNLAEVCSKGDEGLNTFLRIPIHGHKDIESPQVNSLVAQACEPLIEAKVGIWLAAPPGGTVY
jgi:hypothetical protein